jgi:DNA repair exonuclease SbcCD nuclease subunit
VTHMLVNGDVFHLRGIVPVEVYQHVYDLFWHIVHTLGIKVAILVGNHDQSDKAGLIHSVYGLKDLVTVVDRVDHLVIGNKVKVWCVPYIADKNLLKAALDKGSGDLLFAHLGVDGAMVGTVEYRIKDPITVDDLHPDRYKQVFLGHYHKPQQLASNVYYVGSPWQINRNEVGDVKRWILYDTNTNTVQPVLTHAKEFRTVTASEFLDAPDELLTHYYDVLLDTFAHIDELKAKAHGKHVKFLNPRQGSVQESRVAMDEGMTDEQLLTLYIKHVDNASFFSQKLLSLGLQLLAKTRTAAPNNTRLSFLRLVVDNFLTIKHIDLKLHSPGSVIAVQGRNETSEGFTSNGTGKSSLLPESLFWCLWGETARKIPADKVVNRKAKRNCSVTLVLLAGNRKLEVTRYRKHSQLGGDGLRLIIDGTDCTEGTPRLTQVALNRELGVDFVTFSSVLAFSPDTLRFVSDTDSNQKQVLDAILQTRRFSAAQEVAKTALTVVKREYETATQEYQKAQAQLESHQATLAEYTLANANWESQEAERVQGLKDELDEHLQSWRQVTEGLAQIKQERKDLETELEVLQQNPLDLDAADEALLAAIEALSVHKSTVAAQQSKLEEVQSELDAAVGLAGKPCPTCGQAVTNTGKLIATYQRNRNHLATRIKSLELTTVQLTEKKTAVFQAKQDARKHKERISSLKLQIQELQTDITRYAGQADAVAATVKSCREAIRAVPENVYAKLIQDVKRKIDTAQEQTQTTEKLVHQQATQLDRIQFWVTGFGNSGIRSYLLDQIIPQLTEYANGFARKLGDSLQIQFQTHKEGAATDRFTVQAFNEDGADLYKGNSSGEKRRVDLAIMLGLFLIAYHRTRFNILLFDEALDSLDTAGLERVVDMLRDLARDVNLTIYVTSHTSITNLLGESLTLVKRQGTTILET